MECCSISVWRPCAYLARVVLHSLCCICCCASAVLHLLSCIGCDASDVLHSCVAAAVLHSLCCIRCVACVVLHVLCCIRCVAFTMFCFFIYNRSFWFVNGLHMCVFMLRVLVGVHVKVLI